MTKTEAKKDALKVLEALVAAKDLIESLLTEVEETIDSIEPYEGKDDLVPAQEERQEWFENYQSVLEDARDSIEQIQTDLEDATC